MTTVLFVIYLISRNYIKYVSENQITDSEFCYYLCVTKSISRFLYYIIYHSSTYTSVLRHVYNDVVIIIILIRVHTCVYMVQDCLLKTYVFYANFKIDYNRVTR